MPRQGGPHELRLAENGHRHLPAEAVMLTV